MKKLLSVFLMLVLALNLAVPALATAESQSVSTDVYIPQVEEDVAQISVTVPLTVTLELSYNADSGMYEAISPENYGFFNNGVDVVLVTSIAVSMAEGYSLISAEDASTKKTTSKQIVAGVGCGKDSCEMEAAAGAENVMVSEQTGSGFHFEYWKIPGINIESNEPGFLSIQIFARFPGGLDKDWFDGQTQLFTLTYTVGQGPGEVDLDG